ncbi:transglutaminase family protein [Herpetosiphon gulosus]|uniref:Uncharacterized protein Rv2569c n=1 Tax=Herpetosiphon gulosus TaxID=1973496 RepID=A0ABP9X1V1_9CHLR
MYYTIRHVTRFRYSNPISESMMEVRKQPRTEGDQRCLSFDITTKPKSKVLVYYDPQGNTVHHFGIPRAHTQLEIITQAYVENRIQAPADDLMLDLSTWQILEDHALNGNDWDYLNPSQFVHSTDLLQAFATEIGLSKQLDPLSLIRQINQAIYDKFEYVPQSTRADSPIDEALATRRGVCQDYTHIMLSLLRWLQIPARYVSGYLFHRTDDTVRSAADASHAWVEAWLPSLGWVGFDPTNNVTVSDRHIRVALGRDYADVPPTHGIFKGETQSTLEVAVQVCLADEPLQADQPSQLEGWSVVEGGDVAAVLQQMQQQQ